MVMTNLLLIILSLMIYLLKKVDFLQKNGFHYLKQ